MRVRPFFWFLIASVCVAVLIFADLLPEHAPVMIDLQVDQLPATAHAPTTLTLHLMDSEGMPIEQALVESSVTMTNMDMGVLRGNVVSTGNGVYRARLSFSMSGPWAITFVVHADGFETLQHTLKLVVA